MLNAVNPYIAGSPVTGPEMFFGREDVFTFIRQALIGKHRDNIIVLYGQRRTGKTSTLYQLPSHLGPHYLCVFVDLQALHLEGIDGFLWELANHIQRILQREHQIELPHLKRQEFMADARNFFQYKFLDQVWSAIDDRHLLLMLDEAIRLEEQVRTGKLEHQIFEYMSHLMQHYERLNFLFSLGSGLEEMEKEYTLLFRVAIYKKISFLDRDTTTALITNPVKDYYKVEEAAQKRIFQITSGHPYCVQLLCHNLFNRWQRHPTELITVQDVEQVLDEAVERGLAVFKHIWEESTSAEKAVMAAISEITGDTSVPVSTDSINQVWKSYKVRIPQGEMAQVRHSHINQTISPTTDGLAH
jgi:branched-chain amino acid transport system substrate-binding protein